MNIERLVLAILIVMLGVVILFSLLRCISILGSYLAFNTFISLQAAEVLSFIIILIVITLLVYIVLTARDNK